MASDAFSEVLTAAVREIVELGYDSPERLAYWQERLRRAAEESATSVAVMREQVAAHLDAAYRRLVDRGEVVKRHPGIARFTLERIKPHLRAELDRRILASADLIKLNRDEAIETTLRRFAGWSTSIPKGGSRVVEIAEVKANIRKPIQRLPFVERRVAIDQGHKLRASISEVVARDGGAIAGKWHSHWRQAGYNYREDHKERDDRVYLLRKSWAVDGGLVKPGDAGYYDGITAAGEEVFCRCYVTWYHDLRDLPDDMLTKKGREALERVRISA